MTTVNKFLRFQALLPQRTRYTATIKAINSDGTSTAETRDGGRVRVAGTSVAVDGKAWIEDGRIVGEAPVLTEYLELV
ncbi:hypothetical protein [Gilvimarinus sp. 1_MG-2023]|uniref:hypothetical protein n=1 Tax=Gilvimarinus sp. 1_MG-2023 TaxID=3062638 RepID=UPI0026E312EF|nr:hypothetical protein [Gilvimarinus sp. 1_MG-2023]MDO6747221.1 hypothetical protein [Gilvimarinus sp. 1_MG-2023]